MLPALHAAMMVLAPVLSGRVLTVAGVSFLGGMPAAAVGCGALDAVNALHGPAAARRTVLQAAIIRIVAWVVAWNREVLTVALAGEVAMLLSQAAVAVPVFAGLRGVFIWRYSVANVISQTVAVGTMTMLVGGAFWGNWLAQVGLSLALAPAWDVVVRRLA